LKSTPTAFPSGVGCIAGSSPIVGAF